jgi:hypothetical protein
VEFSYKNVPSPDLMFVVRKYILPPTWTYRMSNDRRSFADWVQGLAVGQE